MGFADAYRLLNGEKKMYNWIQNGGSQQTSFDMFLVSESLAPYIKSHEPFTPYKSDHTPLILKIDYSSFVRGKGFWKHNAALLRDP